VYAKTPLLSSRVCLALSRTIQSSNVIEYKTFDQCYYCVMCVYNVDSIAAKFQKIFGYEQFFAHFESSEKFIVALKGKQEMLKHLAEKREKLSVESKDLEGITDDVLSNYVLCTSHVGGEKMRYEKIL
jgi:cell shape-determining protein MreC